MTTMSERQRRFREQYRSNISPMYNGLVHVGVIYAVGLAAIGWGVLSLENVGWEWLVILPVALAGNFAEWAMHRYVMHRKIDVFALRAIYDRHTRQHHQYFTDNEWTIDTIREFRIVFFPWRLLCVLGVLGALFGWIASLLWNPNAGWFVFMTMVGHYLVYEFMHYCCHVHDNAFVTRFPFVSTIRRHHTFHHNQGIMMHYNMNLTFPVADWFMKTSDLDRGLVGTLLNGMDTRHLREDLKPIIARFKRDDSRVTLDGPQLSDDERRVLAPSP
jgi:hypothetical protein